MSTSLPPQLVEQMIEWRHDFHSHPELGFEEIRTSAKVAELLESFGLEVHRNIGQTGVVGMLKKGSGNRAIGMRADMDALAILEQNDFEHKSRFEGKMHACGHDGHTSMLLGAAKALAEQGDFDGIAIFIFQPAEEHGRGALAMMNDDLFHRFPVDEIYSIHNMPSIEAGHIALKTGPIMACEDNFEITITGKGGHAAMPHLANDPIPIASEIVLALQKIISRNLNPIDQAVLSVTDFAVQATRNAIPAQVTLRGDTRSYTPDVRIMLEQNMEKTAQGICHANGAECSFSYSHEFTSTINTKDETDYAADVAEQTVGQDSVNRNCNPLMTSEDFGFMLEQKPGCYLLLGNGTEGSHGCGLHNPNFDFNDEILAVGAQFWKNLVETRLSNSGK